MWKKWWGKQTGVASEEAGGAFASPDKRGPRDRTPEDEELLDRIANAVVKWGMTVPAIFMLESSRPLNFIGSQFLHFLSPLVHSVFNAQELDRLAVLMERRDTMEVLIQRIEAVEAASQSK